MLCSSRCRCSTHRGNVYVAWQLMGMCMWMWMWMGMRCLGAHWHRCCCSCGCCCCRCSGRLMSVYMVGIGLWLQCQISHCNGGHIALLLLCRNRCRLDHVLCCGCCSCHLCGCRHLSYLERSSSQTGRRCCEGLRINAVQMARRQACLGWQRIRAEGCPNGLMTQSQIEVDH